MLLRENTQTLTFEITSNLWGITSDFLAYASFFGAVALTADRFLAAYFYLRDQELVTRKRVVAVVILIQDLKCNSNVAVQIDSFEC